ncbi:hypothetical protein [Synechocystis sp. PCC 7509]|uniref:hypothetical protein n=1 Tax=Synechocystis sp. PCC 7509 TaxID=927677 RepID=UPI0002AC3905|nr:hypothetical protein [Synechocystis sp. PCC 7509]
MTKKSITYLLLVSACLGANLALGNNSLAQTPPNPANNAVQAKPRLRATFFEEERRLRQFGFGDFLRSALDGEQNSFADPAKISGFEANANSLYATPGNVAGTIAVRSTNEDSPNFLFTTFNSDRNFGSLQFSSVQQNSDFRTGTLTVNGTITANGQTVNFVNTRATYNAGISNKNDTVSTVILISDPNNPTQSLYIQLPPTNIAGYQRSDRIPPTPASLSIGFPSDR